MASTQLNEVGGVALRDQIKQPIYDTIEIDETSDVLAERQFFANTQGKPLSLSNLKGQGQLERNKSFRIMGLQVDAYSSDAAKRELLPLYGSNSYVELQLAEKQYWQSPLRLVTGNIRYFSSTFNVNDAFVQFGDAYTAPVMYHSTQALDIGPLTNFVLSWKVERVSAAQITAMTPSEGKPVRFVAQLKGLLRRPVQ